MGSFVAQVIDQLQAHQIRADEAYPGKRIPALEQAVAAVRLGKVDRSVRTTTVLVTIMGPAKSGGGFCESTALKAVTALQNMGGTCKKDVCRFDEMADVFYIEIEVEFFGTATADNWSAGPGYSVTLGIQPMPHTVSFGLQREIDEEVTSISKAKWEFTLEELLPPDATEPPDPAEPFTLSVRRSSSNEVLTECTWISVRREHTVRGIRQVRVGIAKTRSVMGIL